MSRRDTSGKARVCPPAGDLPKGDKTVCMSYFTYVLRSGKNGDFYVGSTEDVGKRINLHNEGRVKSTKGYRPWELVECHKFNSRSEAIKHELFLKTGQQKEGLRKKYGVVAKW